MKLRSTLLLFLCSIGTTLLLFGPARGADQKPIIPVIVKDTTSFYWQTVLAGARKAGQDLDVSVPELGAQSSLTLTAKSPFWRTRFRRTRRQL